MRQRRNIFNVINYKTNIFNRKTTLIKGNDTLSILRDKNEPLSETFTGYVFIQTLDVSITKRNNDFKYYYYYKNFKIYENSLAKYRGYNLNEFVTIFDKDNSKND